MADGAPDKNWGFIALLVVLIIAVFIMVFYSFKWGQPGGRYNEPGAVSSQTPTVSIAPPPVQPTPIQ